ncbi:GON-4-like protein [Tubulanus polymorphus]|uniref:GON-4-like protein n=1 Tax=Tubulanus polymorphus TaxID=672921 RepID=UPI003DA43E2A
MRTPKHQPACSSEKDGSGRASKRPRLDPFQQLSVGLCPRGQTSKTDEKSSNDPGQQSVQKDSASSKATLSKSEICRSINLKNLKREFESAIYERFKRKDEVTKSTGKQSRDKSSSEKNRTASKSKSPKRSSRYGNIASVRRRLSVTPSKDLSRMPSGINSQESPRKDKRSKVQFSDASPKTAPKTPRRSNRNTPSKKETSEKQPDNAGLNLASEEGLRHLRELSEQLHSLNEDSGALTTTLHKSNRKKEKTPRKRKPISGKKLFKLASPSLSDKNTDAEDDASFRIIDPDLELETNLEESAHKAGMNATNVKSLIKEVITNEHVIAMMKSALEEADLDEENGEMNAEKKTSPLRSVPYEPKMTRAKLKEIVSTGQTDHPWMLSPIKVFEKEPQPTILDLKFEDDDDDEYNPDDDDESGVASEEDTESFCSQPASLSEIDSPRPLTPSTPTFPFLPYVAGESSTPKTTRSKTKDKLLMRPPIELPAPFVASKRLYANQREDNDNEDTGTIALRTRSRLPLKETRLEDIESHFVAPDITPDMYDTSTCYDDDWSDFLTSLMKSELGPQDGNDTLDDDADPEYNFLADVEDVDWEDFRDDRAVRVSKKEVNELLDELIDAYEAQNHGNFADEEPTPVQNDIVDPSDSRNMFNCPPPLNFTPSAQRYLLIPIPPDPPPPPPPVEPICPNVIHVAPLVQQNQTDCDDNGYTFTEFEALKLQEQLRQHVQLLFQVNVLTREVSGYEGECQTTALYLAEIEKLECLSKRINVSSFFDVYNLPMALETVRRIPNNKRILPPTQRVRTRSKLRGGVRIDILPEEHVHFFATHRACVYPKLMPVVKLILPDVPIKTKLSFFPAENNLIVLGISQLSEKSTMSEQAKFIHEYLMPVKSEKDIKSHIRHMKWKKNNPIQAYKDFKQLPPVDQSFQIFDPNKVKLAIEYDEEEFPQWIRSAISVKKQILKFGRRRVNLRTSAKSNKSKQQSNKPNSSSQSPTVSELISQTQSSRELPSSTVKTCEMSTQTVNDNVQAPPQPTAERTISPNIEIHQENMSLTLMSSSNHVIDQPNTMDSTEQHVESGNVSITDNDVNSADIEFNNVVRDESRPISGQSSSVIEPSVDSRVDDRDFLDNAALSENFTEDPDTLLGHSRKCEADSSSNDAVVQKSSQTLVQSPPAPPPVMIVNSSPNVATNLSGSTSSDTENQASTSSPVAPSTPQQQQCIPVVSIFVTPEKFPADSTSGNTPIQNSSDSPEYMMHLVTPPDKSRVTVSLQGVPASALTTPESTPSKTRRIVPKSPVASTVPTVSPFLDKIAKSPKRANLRQKVRAIVPKGFPYSLHAVSPTKMAADNIKSRLRKSRQRLSYNTGSPTKHASVLHKSQPVPILPKPLGRGMHLLSQSTAESQTNRKDDSDSESDHGNDHQDDHIAELLAASSTIRISPKKKKIGRSRREDIIKAITADDLVDSDHMRDERDKAFANAYMKKVKDTLKDEKEVYEKFLVLLSKFGDSSGSPVQLYADLQSLLKKYPDLIEEFAGFLLPEQAQECGCYSTNQQFSQARSFLRKLEVICGKNTNQLQKLVTAMSKCQSGEPGTEEELAKLIKPLLKGYPHLLDEFSSFFPENSPPKSSLDDFEEVSIDSDEENDAIPDEFEEIAIPNTEFHGTARCTCECHINANEPKLAKKTAHCRNCSLRVIEGDVYLITRGRTDFSQPVQVVYSDRAPPGGVDEEQLEAAHTPKPASTEEEDEEDYEDASFDGGGPLSRHSSIDQLDSDIENQPIDP